MKDLNLTDRENFSDKFYELDQFLGCYFHQFWKEALDWQGEKPSFESVVRYYKINEPLESVSKATEMLQDFLALNLSEEEIRKLFVRTGIWYGPSYQGMNYRQWLEPVLDILKDGKTPKSTLKFKGAASV